MFVNITRWWRRSITQKSQIFGIFWLCTLLLITNVDSTNSTPFSATSFRGIISLGITHFRRNTFKYSDRTCNFQMAEKNLTDITESWLHRKVYCNIFSLSIGRLCYWTVISKHVIKTMVNNAFRERFFFMKGSVIFLVAILLHICFNWRRLDLKTATERKK